MSGKVRLSNGVEGRVTTGGNSGHTTGSTDGKENRIEERRFQIKEYVSEVSCTSLLIR